MVFDVPSRDFVTHTHGHSVKDPYIVFASNCNLTVKSYSFTHAEQYFPLLHLPP